MDIDNRLAGLGRFAEAYSTQLRAAHRLWLGLATLSIIALLSLEDVARDRIQIPFDLGTAKPWAYFLLMGAILSVNAIAFASAYTQAIRTRQLIQRYIEASRSEGMLPGNLDVQDVFDMLHAPGLNRTAPLAQFLLGKWQFFPEAQNRPAWLACISGFYYVVLRIAAMVVFLGLPAVALCLTLNRIREVGDTSIWLVAPIALLSGISLIQLVVGECLFTFRVFGSRFTGNRSPPPARDR